MRLLAVSPHPDDVEYAIGGTLLLARNAGHEIIVFCNTMLDDGEAQDDLGIRMKEATKSARELGTLSFFRADDATPNIAASITQISPDIIFLPDPNDFHPVHRMVCSAVFDAVTYINIHGAEEHAISQLFYYETFSSERFEPDVIIDVSATFAGAKKLLHIHTEGIKRLPAISHKFTIQHQYRGIQGSCFYGEGLRLAKNSWFQWCKNRTKGLEFLLSLIVAQ